MKVYVIVDIEGIAGVVFYASGRGDTHAAHAINTEGRILMTEEANAAVRGAVAAGADEVIIHDHHGVGYNIIPERLDERAELIHGRNAYRVGLQTLHPDLDETVDATVLLGMHAMAGTPDGGLPHSLIQVITSDGREYALSEPMESAAWSGSFGVPTVLVSGDAAMCREVQSHIPGIECVISKRHYAPQLARTRSPVLVRKMIESGVEAAVRRRAKIRPFRIDGRCTVRIADKNPDKKWPVDAVECVDYRTALMDTMARVPWYVPIPPNDDGWRYPDRQQTGSFVSEWN